MKNGTILIINTINFFLKPSPSAYIYLSTVSGLGELHTFLVETETSDIEFNFNCESKLQFKSFKKWIKITFILKLCICDIEEAVIGSNN